MAAANLKKIYVQRTPWTSFLRVLWCPVEASSCPLLNFKCQACSFLILSYPLHASHSSFTLQFMTLPCSFPLNVNLWGSNDLYKHCLKWLTVPDEDAPYDTNWFQWKDQLQSVLSFAPFSKSQKLNIMGSPFSGWRLLYIWSWDAGKWNAFDEDKLFTFSSRLVPAYIHPWLINFG